MILFNQVTKRYPDGFEALTHINFSVAPGEMVFLTGHSGAGKSSVLKLIALLDKPSSGVITVNGSVLNHMKPRDVSTYRSRLGVTLQAPTLLHDRSVFDNVALTLQIQAMPKSSIEKRVRSVLELVGLSSKATLRPAQLSGGEQQRVGIARAVVHKPLILLADEPTGHLDPGVARDMMQLFSTLNQAGVTVLIATHDLALIASMKHRIVMLKGGRLC